MLAAMQFRMNPNSLFAILLRKPWWVSAAIAAVISLFSWLALPTQWIIVGASAALPFIILALITGWRRLRTPGEGRIAETEDRLRAMNWPQLAEAVTQAWKRDGYEVVAVNETGVDFEVAKGGRRGLISARRWKAARLGIEPLRELDAARDRREVRDGWYLVTGEVTEAARSFAAKHRIVLVEGVELARRMSGKG